ncbi:lytic transglycosylase domain-containing protein [Terrimonas alba]|uniref:lytic transglycosylase domain-containing protein n=1 Tax=Terrimonas alba TaxID=3349636 RepID=UPI0035F2965A
MLKQLGFICIICIVSIATSAFARNENRLNVTFLISDTVDIQLKDSLATEIIAARNPKEDFKDLFVTSATSTGVSVEQLNPLALSFVEDYMEKFGKSMEKMKGWGKPYFDMMDNILAKHGLPAELKYLAVIESNLKSNAKSWAGAVGPWQLMPATARNLGLRINRKVDERRDIYKSTHAASRYLTNLFSIYGDWLLVIAAYNGGPGNVNSAIKRSGSRDFWKLQKYLPAESRKHVKKFIATHYIMEGEGGITTLTKKEAANFLLANNTTPVKVDLTGSIAQTINGRYNASVIVKHIEMDLASFQKINPDFDNMIASNGKYELRLPSEKMDVFRTKKNDILAESIQLLLNPDAVSSSTPH